MLKIGIPFAMLTAAMETLIKQHECKQKKTTPELLPLMASNNNKIFLP